jgi:hypothetical protein
MLVLFQRREGVLMATLLMGTAIAVVNTVVSIIAKDLTEHLGSSKRGVCFRS